MLRFTLVVAVACAQPTVVAAPRCLESHVDPHARGAYFRKVASRPRADTHGIRVRVRLPDLAFDPAREYAAPGSQSDYRTGPLDRPSVYIGGTAANHEVDVGLTWDRVYDGSGAAQSELAFRPYWRTTNGKNEWHQPRVGSRDNVYFYPGETITMTLAEAGRDLLRLDIAGEHSHFVQTFEQLGFGDGAPQVWKRVSSIDQFMLDANHGRVGLEGRDVLPTHTTALHAAWTSAELLGASGDAIGVLGCDSIEVRGADTASRYDVIFVRSALDERGGETLDIVPDR
jgi:hypothetical protein